MSRQDRQGARTPADLEYRYAFGKSFAELMGIANDARTSAEEAKKVSASVKETNDGIELKVKTMEGQLDGALALEIVEADDGSKYSRLSAGVDKMVFKSGDISIESEKFTLDEDGNATFSGELKAASGTFAGNVISESNQAFGGVHTAALQDGIVKITSPTATVLQEGVGYNTYVPVIELTHGGKTYVLAFLLNDDGSAAAVVKNKDDFATST